MTGVLTVMLVVALSMLITRVAAEALVVTGLSREAALFQARSALTGTGFTTSESETVVQHPVRRRIVLLLMLVGRAGVVTVIASLTVSFAGATSTGDALRRLAALAGGGVVLMLMTRSRPFNRFLSRLIQSALRRYTRLEVHDYAALLHVAGEYGVSEVEVRPDDRFAGHTLEQLDLRSQGIIVLGIERAGGTYEGAPPTSAVLRAGDRLVLYGHDDALAEACRQRPRTGPA